MKKSLIALCLALCLIFAEASAEKVFAPETAKEGKMQAVQCLLECGFSSEYGGDDKLSRWEEDISIYIGGEATREDIEKVWDLRIIASSDEAGVYIVQTKGGRQIFVTGHSEYDPETLKTEYLRDKSAGLPIHVPRNYFPGDDDTQEPLVRWRGHGNLLFSNWLNYFVYQTTPYDIMEIGEE